MKIDINCQTIEEIIKRQRKTWIDNKALELRGWRMAAIFITRHANTHSTAERAGWRPNLNHSAPQQYANAVAFIIKMAKTSRLGIELVGAQEFYMHASDAAYAHRTTFMAKMAKPFVCISSKAAWELVKEGHIKAKKNYKNRWMNSPTQKLCRHDGQ